MLPNGLYAVEMKTLDGVNAVAAGVAVARDGVVMGGDPYFYYTGRDSCKNGALKAN
jgi:T3SS negative regulator,GrlR